MNTAALARSAAVLALLLALMLVFSSAAFAATNQQRKAVVHQAHTYLGVPYGHGPNEMTCTDLTRMSYGPTLGVWLPYTLSGQRRKSHHVRVWRRGDLVFYDSYVNGTMDHVALYVGDGKVIDANAYWGLVLKQPVDSIPGYIIHKRVT